MCKVNSLKIISLSDIKKGYFQVILYRCNHFKQVRTRISVSYIRNYRIRYHLYISIKYQNLIKFYAILTDFVNFLLI